MTNPRVRSIDYDHAAMRAAHTVTGARRVLKALFPDKFPQSVLDIGCGAGTWLTAALECGATEILGVDGVAVPDDHLLIPKENFDVADLNRPFDAGRTFDLVLCMETAEHLERGSSETLVQTLTRHGPLILFSAAVPRQAGVHHVNCQWPDYWQGLFNGHGYRCDDSVRWRIWDDREVEPWYRQNLFTAIKDEPAAGKEPRIKGVVHPVMLESGVFSEWEENLSRIEHGSQPWSWYVRAPLKAAAAKLSRAVRQR